MAGPEIISLISGSITILDAIHKGYRNTQAAGGLPPAFREVSRRLPLALDTLRAVETQIKERDLDEETRRAVKDILEACRNKAKSLEGIIDKVALQTTASRRKQYYAVVRSLGKGHRVETLMHDILKDVQLLAGHNAVKSATAEQVQELLEAMRQLSEMSPSVPEETAHTYENFGSGPQNINNGKGTQNINTGKGNVNTYHAEKMTFEAIPDISNESHRNRIADQILSQLLVVCSETVRDSLISEKGDRVYRTCEWLSTYPAYLDWQRSPESEALWIYGGPGKGKTMLAIYVTQELERLASDGRIVLYFFCDSSDPKRKSACSILCGLLYQLLGQRKQLAGEIHEYFNTSNKASYTLSSVERLWKVFDILVQKLDTPIYCVLDGLDECDEKTLDILLKKFKRLSSETDPDAGLQRFKLLVVSRDWPPLIQRQLSGAQKLNLDSNAEVQSDLDRFITAKIDELANESLDIHLTEPCLGNVRRCLKEGAEGNFLWVALVAAELKDKPEEDVAEVLRSVPKGLHGIYRRMLQQIRLDKEKVAAILTWVVLAFEPLSVAELAAATHVEGSDTQTPEQKMMNRIQLCGRFFRLENGKVRMVHQSAKDYLLQDARGDQDTAFYNVKVSEGHLTLAKTCLWLSAEFDFEYHGKYYKNHQKLKDNALIPYATSYGALHLFFAVKWSFTDMVKVTFLMVPLMITRTATPSLLLVLELCFDVCHGVAVLLSYVLTNRRRDELEMEDVFGQRPLSRAARQGETKIVKLLLDEGADVNARDTSKAGMTPLHWASQLGDEEAVALLLERGASPDAIAFDDKTPLALAIESGSNSALQRQLSENPNLDYSYSIVLDPTWPLKCGTALCLLLCCIQLDLLLTPHGVFLHFLRSALVPVALSVLTLETSRGKFFRVTTRPMRLESAHYPRISYRTPLLRAVELENADAVMLLLKQGADPNFAPSHVPTPLALARKLDNTRITKLLEECGAVVGSAQDGFFGLPKQ